MLTLADVSLWLVALIRKPLVALSNDNTAASILHILWILYLPVVVLYVN